MDRYQIIRIIHDYMSKKPVLKAWIFGSFARGEEKAQSDIDILFVPDFEHGSFTLLTHGGMYEDLKQLLGREVDLVVHGYSQVLPRILWATAKENIPEIKAQVEKYLNETDWEHYCGE